MVLHSTLINGGSDQKAKENGKVLRCPKCSFITKGRGNLKLHSLIHQEKSFSCFQCNFVTKFKKLLQVHEETHVKIGVEEFKCPDCPYSSSRKCSLLRHLFVHRKVIIHKCSLCKFQACSVDELEAHKSVHKRKSLSCPVCDFGTKHQSDLLKHMKSHTYQQELEEPPKQKLYMCALCQYNTELEVSFKVHLLEHHRIKTAEGHNLFEFTPPLHPSSASCLSGVERKRLKSKSLIKACPKSKKLKTTLNNPPKATKSTQNKKPKSSKVKNIDVGTTLKSCAILEASKEVKRQRPNRVWPVEEKREIYWCHVFSRYKSFEKYGGAVRRRMMLIERGILDLTKLSNTTDTRLDNIVSYIKYGKSKVSKEDQHSIDKEVDEYMKQKKNIMRENRRLEREKQLDSVESNLNLAESRSTDACQLKGN